MVSWVICRLRKRERRWVWHGSGTAGCMEGARVLEATSKDWSRNKHICLRGITSQCGHSECLPLSNHGNQGHAYYYTGALEEGVPSSVLLHCGSSSLILTHFKKIWCSFYPFSEVALKLLMGFSTGQWEHFVTCGGSTMSSSAAVTRLPAKPLLSAASHWN